MLKNLKLVWKFAILAIMIPVTAITIGYFALQGVGQLKYEYDNLYGFMLIPIMRLDEGNLNRETLARNIVEFSQPDLSSEARGKLSDSIKQHDAGMSAVIAQYENEYLTTLSPEFSATLASLGKQDLQAAEAEALKNYHASYDAYSKMRDSLLAGKTIDANDLQTRLNEVGNSFASLVETNRVFADLSNESAQAAISSMRLNLIIAGILATLLSLVVALWLTRLVTGALKSLTEASKKLAEGDLDVVLTHESGDELGQMTAAFRNMVDYLKGVADVATRIASNDLTGDVIPKSNKDVLSNAFMGMTGNLRATIHKVIENANQLTGASSELASSADQAGRATSQIAVTVQQVARGTTQQSESVSRTALSVEQMAHAIEGLAKGAQEQASAVEQASNITTELTNALSGVAGNAEAVSRDSARAAQSAREGAATVRQTLEGMQTIKLRVDHSASKVQEMGQRSQEIGAIVEAIEDIASQTNLLALNAAIEAARAGEHGKGFAVVADEVRKLAEKSAISTKEIGGLIRGIQKTVDEAVEAMNQGVEEIDRGLKQASGAGETLNNILTAADAVNQQAQQASQATQTMNKSALLLVQSMESVSAVVEENTAATEQMTASSNEVSQAIENIASVSEENSAAVEEVSASTEEMSAQVEEVSASSETLAEMAHQLQAVVASFKI
jgi:methyl-accepting chemotaxis protein